MGEDNYSLGSRVFHMIRENILSGKYERDEELKEKSIGGTRRQQNPCEGGTASAGTRRSGHDHSQ